MNNFFKIKIDKNKIFGLDALRAFAILFVVYQHAGNYLPKQIKHFYNAFIIDGVSIFFVLSGFLIGQILIHLTKENKFNKKVLLQFWRNRWLRTFPIYFLTLLILIILNLFFNSAFSINSIKSYFIFSQNLNSIHPLFFPEAWSLSIEEWFYLIVPICLFIFIQFLKINFKKSFLIIILSILILVTLYRLYKFNSYEIRDLNNWDLHLRKQVFTRLDSIMYGIFGAYFQFFYQKKWIKNKIIYFWIGITLLIFTKVLGGLKLKPIDGIYNCVFSFSVFSLAILLLIPYLSSIKHSTGYLRRFLSYTSAISYSMYLLHLSIVQFWIIDKINWSYFNIDIRLLIVIKYMLFWMLTFMFSLLFYKYIEYPIMSLKNKKLNI